MARLTLHEAMVMVIRRRGGGWMSRDDIAEEIAADRLYLRIGDGEPAPSDQLRRRARKYPHLFECNDKACTRIRLREPESDEPAVVDETQTAVDPRTVAARSESERAAAHLRRVESAERYKPETLRLLLVAESPPTSLDRYFYFENVAMQDSLFRYVVRSILRVEPTREGKAELLTRLRESGVFLIDLKVDPLDRRPLADHVPDLVTRARRLDPEALILIKTTVYDAALTSLKREELPVIDERIPFPGSGQQKRFQAAMARALAKASFDAS